MSVSKLTASSQNYLKAIWSLQEWSNAPVTPSRLAAKAGVKLPAVSDAIRKLAEQGLVDHTPYGAVALTEAGRMHAVAMIRRHRLIETFLVNVLGYRWDQVHDEADALEHAVSDFMIERIDQHLGHPERDPHGDPIPKADGEIARLDAAVLTDAPIGSRVRIERIADDDPELLQYFTDHGIGVGSLLEVREGAPYSGGIDLIVTSPAGAEGHAGDTDTDDGASQSPAEPTIITLGSAATDAIWVAPTV